MQNKYISDIIETLEKDHPEKIILFGSHAYGTVSEDSDIDLIVVTRDEFFPKNYRERMEVQLKISRKLSEIIKKIPIDLIVYTKPMYKKFLALDSLFAREIVQNGRVLYENYN